MNWTIDTDPLVMLRATPGKHKYLTWQLHHNSDGVIQKIPHGYYSNLSFD